MVNFSITHVLVPVDPNDGLQASQLAALQLASGMGAMVTLLYVHERYVRLKVTSELDALSNLHAVLSAPPEENQAAPVHADQDKRPALKRLQEMRDQLALVGPDDTDIRVAFRSGDPRREIDDFINETGVDVVMVQSPAACTSKMLRRIARMLQKRCPCQLQIVYPPHRPRPTLRSQLQSWWKSWKSPRREFDRAMLPGALRVNEP